MRKGPVKPLADAPVIFPRENYACIIEGTPI